MELSIEYMVGGCSDHFYGKGKDIGIRADVSN